MFSTARYAASPVLRRDRLTAALPASASTSTYVMRATWMTATPDATDSFRAANLASAQRDLPTLTLDRSSRDCPTRFTRPSKAAPMTTIATSTTTATPSHANPACGTRAVQRAPRTAGR